MSTLVQLFTNIANAIREKKGTEGLIDAENFPQEIASIPTGTTPTGVIDIVENGLINVSDYATANVNVSTDINAYYANNITNRFGCKVSY